MSNRKLQVSYLFLVLVALFCVCLVASNLFAAKPFTFGHLSFTGAILIFPLSYIINDVVAEVWGFRKARALIWLAFGLNFFFVIAGFIVDIIPGAPWWEETASSGFHAVFGLAPRVAGASFLAFIVGSYVNAMVIWKSGGQQPLWGAVRFDDILPDSTGRSCYPMESDAYICPVAGVAEDCV